MLGAFERCAADSDRLVVMGTHVVSAAGGLAEAVAAAAPQGLVLECNQFDEAIRAQVRTLMVMGSRPGLVALSATAPASFDEDLRKILHEWGASVELLSKAAVAGADDFATVVQQVMEGRIVIDTATSGGLFNDPSQETDHLPKLTAREMEVLDLVATGYRNQAVADALFLEPKTVDSSSISKRRSAGSPMLCSYDVPTGRALLRVGSSNENLLPAPRATDHWL